VKAVEIDRLNVVCMCVCVCVCVCVCCSVSVFVIACSFRLSCSTPFCAYVPLCPSSLTQCAAPWFGDHLTHLSQLGTHLRGKKKREELMGVIVAQRKLAAAKKAESKE
jgi:hypothetical protein